MSELNLNEITARAAEAKALAESHTPAHPIHVVDLNELRTLVPQLCEDIAALATRVEELEREHAQTRTTLNNITAFASGWSANRMGSVDLQRKRWLRFAEMAKTLLDELNKSEAVQS